MFTEKIIDRAARNDLQLITDRSRCMRMRLDGSRCSACIDICPAGAICIDEDVIIDEGKCTGCMLCSSACPSDSFGITGLDFYSMLGRIRKIEASVSSAVLGCISGNRPCHLKTACFGFLSEEHIIALSVFLENPVQMDMTGCAACRNSAIINTARQRITDAEERTSIKISGKVRPITSIDDLVYHALSYDRRGFFRALKNMTFVGAAGFFDGDALEDAATAYSSKKVPFRRDLLNRILKSAAEVPRKLLLNNYYCMVSASGECDECGSCIGICPTGALSMDRSETDGTLLFNSSFCSGCGLCESFCIKGALSVKRGFSGRSPFAFARVKKEELCTV